MQRELGYMTTGDLIEYVRAQEELAAIRTIAARQPWKANDLRSAQNAALRQLATIATRYS